MWAAGSLLSLKSTAGKLGFLVVKLASFEQGCSGYPRPWGGTRTVRGDSARRQDLRGSRPPLCKAEGARAGASALAAWGEKIEFALVTGNGFG